MALKGSQFPTGGSSITYTAGRSHWTQPEGSLPAYIHEARIFNVNMVSWTVDVITIFDTKTMCDIQVASPYMNPIQGEGIYVCPEVGSKCLVCIPSDGPPPFVLAFIMPMETIPDASSAESPAGTAPRGGAGGTQPKGDFTFSGGRKRGKPGDIVIRGRDGNFMIMHRGGVAQFGCSALAQRICIPLGNLVTDISQNYNHFNSGGAINWGVQDRGNASPEAEYRQTLRVFADDEFADIRFDMGTVRSPVPEPEEDAGETSINNQLDIGISEPVVFEMVMANGGFDTTNGDFKAEPADVYLKIFVDRAGNMMGRFEGNVNLRFKKKLYITVDDNVVIHCKKNVSLTADGTLTLTGKGGASLGTAGGAMALNGGTQPVATVGSTVDTPIPPGILQVLAGPALQAVGIPIGTPLGFVGPGKITGITMTGNPTILG